MLPLLLARATAGVPAPCDTQRWLGNWRWKSRLARHKTGVNRTREASRWCGSVRQLFNRPQLARHGPRAASSSASPHPSNSMRRYACAAWHVALVWRCRFQLARHTTGAHYTREPPAGAVPFRRLRTVYNQRRMAFARSKLECCASSQQQRAQVHQLRARNVALSWRWRPQLARRTTSA